MNTIELENKVLELLDIDNYFDMILAVKQFEPEYKQSNFYKTTKMNLLDVIKNAKWFYTLKWNNIKKEIQKLVDGVSLENFTQLLDNLGNLFEADKEQTISTLKELKEIANFQE